MSRAFLDPGVSAAHPTESALISIFQRSLTVLQPEHQHANHLEWSRPQEIRRVLPSHVCKVAFHEHPLTPSERLLQLTVEGRLDCATPSVIASLLAGSGASCSDPQWGVLRTHDRPAPARTGA
jgi:hypothetical protein